MLKRKRAQSTLEYIAVFAAIVGAIIIFAYLKLKPAVENVMDSSATKITTATSDFTAQSTK
ncbi:MAG: hypothetical protein PHO03_00205 [Candidatus Omnitrophica bacterium]|nr:hypothetical protein [Candidatus Omnitrophota bacterium]